MKVCGSTVKLQLILDVLSAVEAGGIRGVAVKCLDITKNSYCEGSLLNCSTPLKLAPSRRDEGGGTSEVAVKCIDITWNPDSEGSFPGSF